MDYDQRSVEYKNVAFVGSDANGKSEEKKQNEIKTYKKRFWMLFLASLCHLMNAMASFQYTVVSDIISCFYGVSDLAVDWTCIMFMAIFVPCVFPVMYVMDTKGLRYFVIIGGFLNLTGSWMQCFSVAKDRFWVIMVSQGVYGIGQVFLLSLPSFLAAIWFPADEVALACAFLVFGNQLGIASGFFIPPMVVDNNCTHQVEIAQGLQSYAYSLAAINTVLFMVLVFAFQDKPKHFPSIAQANKTVTSSYIASLKNLFKNVPFVLLFIAYGLIIGTYLGMSANLNQIVLFYFKNAEKEVGWMGVIMVFTGMAGSLFFSAILDRTHRFKEISLLVFATSFVLMVIYSLLIVYDVELWVQFLLFGLLGFFTAGYLPVGFDFAAEITYPESEAMSGSLINASSAIFTIAVTYISAKLIEVYGDTASNVLFGGVLLLGTILTACIKCELKRNNADLLESQKTENNS